MTRFQLTLKHGNREAEGTHLFDGPADLLSQSTDAIMRLAMEAMEREAGLSIGKIGYEIYESETIPNMGARAVTGHLIFHGTQQEPFSATIAQA